MKITKIKYREMVSQTVVFTRRTYNDGYQFTKKMHVSRVYNFFVT